MSAKHTRLQILKGKRTHHHHSLLFFWFGFILELMKDARLMALETETLCLATEQAGQGKPPCMLLLCCFCSKPHPNGRACPWHPHAVAFCLSCGNNAAWKASSMPLASLLLLRSSGFNTQCSKYFRATLLDAATPSFFAAKAVLRNRFERDDPLRDEREG